PWRGCRIFGSAGADTRRAPRGRHHHAPPPRMEQAWFDARATRWSRRPVVGLLIASAGPRGGVSFTGRWAWGMMFAGARGGCLRDPGHDVCGPAGPRKPMTGFRFAASACEAPPPIQEAG